MTCTHARTSNAGRAGCTKPPAMAMADAAWLAAAREALGAHVPETAYTFEIRIKGDASLEVRTSPA